MFGFLKKKKLARFTPSLPLTWWIDDLSHSVCGLMDDPVRGLKNMPWPDCDKVYLAIDKTAYDELLRKQEALEFSLDVFGGWLIEKNCPTSVLEKFREARKLTAKNKEDV